MEREYQKPEVEVVTLITEEVTFGPEGVQDVISAPSDENYWD